MGFRCPACGSDFAKSRDAFKDHLTNCDGGRTIVSAVLTTSDDDDAKNALGFATKASQHDHNG